MCSRRFLVSAFLPSVVLTAAHAGVSPAQAETLKSTLTPMGAERAGNAAGTIPGWDGGFKGARPAGLKPGEVGKDPFPEDKPILRIAGKDIDRYAGNLTESTKQVLRLLPDFYLNVYPTRRTGVAPQAVYDATFKNATSASLTDANMRVAGAFGGIPFPIPKTGGEVLWNHFLSWKGGAISTQYAMYMTTTDGRRSLASEIDILEQYAYYLTSAKDKFDGYWWLHKGTTTAPSRSVGEAVIGRWPIDFTAMDLGSWQYLPGQRRVRKLPNVSYDTPNFYMSGLMNFDEAYGFFGKPDQYDFKIVGKQEMYIPYNTNKVNGATADDLWGNRFFKPEMLRWELHRVWVIEGSILAGKRNVIPKRRLYVDEDTWNIVMTDQWDAQGKIWRGMMGFSMVAYDVPAVLPLPFATYDFQQNAWSLGGQVRMYKPVEPKSANFFNPDSLVQEALR